MGTFVIVCLLIVILILLVMMAGRMSEVASQLSMVVSHLAAIRGSVETWSHLRAAGVPQPAPVQVPPLPRLPDWVGPFVTKADAAEQTPAYVPPVAAVGTETPTARFLREVLSDGVPAPVVPEAHDVAEAPAPANTPDAAVVPEETETPMASAASGPDGAPLAERSAAGLDAHGLASVEEIVPDAGGAPDGGTTPKEAAVRQEGIIAEDHALPDGVSAVVPPVEPPTARWWPAPPPSAGDRPAQAPGTTPAWFTGGGLAPTGAPVSATPEPPVPLLRVPEVRQPETEPVTMAKRSYGFQVNENWIGRNILPLLAAALGLAGLVFLGIVVVPYLNDAAKITLMFVISLAVGGLGYGLFRRRSSVLTQALIGTGLGGVFIAILVTHLYFHAINDIVAFVLLAVWTVASLWLGKHTRSLLVAILAHAGMVVSIVMGYAGTVADNGLIRLMAYQIVVSLAIIIGNYFWVRAMYRFGLFAAQAMVLVSVIAMWARLVTPEPPPAVPGWWVTTGLLVQFVGASVIAYLLFLSCARVKEPRVVGLLGALNATLWAAVLIRTITVLLSKASAAALGLGPSAIWYNPHTIPLSLTVTVVVAFLPVLALALVGRTLPIKPTLEMGTVIPLAVVSGGAMCAAFGIRLNQVAPEQMRIPTLSWLIAPAVAYLVLRLLTRTDLHAWIARIFLALDAVLMAAAGGYRSLSDHWSVWASLGYLIVLSGLAYVSWRQLDASMRARNPMGPPIIAFAAFEVSLAVLVVTSVAGYRPSLFVFVTMLALVVLRVAGKRTPDLFYRPVEALTASGAAVALWQAGARREFPQLGGGPAYSSGALTLSIILGSLALVGLMVIFVDWIRLAAQATSYALRTPDTELPDTTREIISGVGLTIAGVGVLLPYRWFVHHTAAWLLGFPVSLAAMVVALIVVGLGLWSRVKTLRLYGLVLTIVCVLKLVTLDIASASSITRVVAFLGGAAVCFGISALYNYAARQFDHALAAEPVVPPYLGATPADVAHAPAAPEPSRREADSPSLSGDGLLPEPDAVSAPQVNPMPRP